MKKFTVIHKAISLGKKDCFESKINKLSEVFGVTINIIYNGLTNWIFFIEHSYTIVIEYNEEQETIINEIKEAI